MSRPPADPRRLDDQRHGHLAEALACAVMMMRGYRIRARRERTPYGEIDIIAVRGSRVAFVEVKYRPTVEDGYAALQGAQSRRIADAAEHWVSRRRAFEASDL
ncbi:MAG: YraN family protein, partial [Hyphomicrobiales bacterium]|nr:YraN family protein [Hyphomicrobiales bacterium]